MDLFPSIPIDKASEIIANWLKRIYVEQSKHNLHIRCIRLYMNASYFKIIEKFYKGRGLYGMPHFITNICIAQFEEFFHRLDDILYVMHYTKSFKSFISEHNHASFPFENPSYFLNNNNVVLFSIRWYCNLLARISFLRHPKTILDHLVILLHCSDILIFK